MKANKMLIAITALVLGFVAIVGFALFGRDSGGEETQKDKLDVAIQDLTPEELRQMGIEGDTEKDTVRTLIGTVKSNNKKVERVLEDNEQLRKENAQLKQRDDDVQYRIDEAVRNETQMLNQQINALQQELVDAKNAILGNGASGTTLGGNGATPSGFGLDGESLPGQGQTNQGQMMWVEPSDKIGLDGNGNPILDNVLPTKVGFPNDFSQDKNNLTDSRNSVKGTQKKGLPFIGDSDENGQGAYGNSRSKGVVPFYTIPENSTLLGSVAMTALLGRVPLDNNVTDPYPFKVLIGRENLIANGIELPDVEGAIASGTATGDWTLSCVRGTVTSLTFVFSDGRIVTTSQNGGGNSNDQSIGWLSNPQGIPCIPGERKTNAPEYLGANFLLAGASAAAQGFSQAQTTTVVDGSSVVGAVTGDQGKFILGQALGGGLKDTADWFRQRYGQMFDAVYVPPGQPVAININSSINIDYNKAARKVNYQRKSHDGQLD